MKYMYGKCVYHKQNTTINDSALYPIELKRSTNNMLCANCMSNRT